MLKYKSKIEIGDGIYFNYLLYVPEDYKENMPLLLFLHGIGERGSNVDDVERYSLPNYLNSMDIPYLVVAPQCSSNNFWDYHLRDVEKVLNIVRDSYNYDKNRVFVLGSSMGAVGAWNYIIQRPELFKGIISASGRVMLPLDENLERIKDKAILIYHGNMDDVIDVQNSIYIYNKLKALGASNVTLNIIEDGNHYVCSTAYKEKKLYKWLDKNI